MLINQNRHYKIWKTQNNLKISPKIDRCTSITKSKNLIVWCLKPLGAIIKKCGVYKIILKNVTLLTNTNVKVSTNVNNVVQMFIFPYVIFHWQICRLEEKIKICSRKCFEVPMIEEYDHRHQLYVFYFSIFMPSFHLFPVGLFSYFQIWMSPTINRRKKKTILTCKKAKSKG